MIIVICGPTGVGKTKLSIELAKKYNAEIINADSMQTYIGMNIATAKIKDNERDGVFHHLFDINDPKDMYTIYDYQRDARSKIEEISANNKNIIFVGGSGLYIKSALYDLEFSAEDEKKDYSYLSVEDIINKLSTYTNISNVDINNRRRLERLLEKYENGSVIGKNSNNKLYDFICIGLTTDRDNLYNIINNRVDKMISEGLVQEARSFYDKNIHSKAIQTCIGYKELYKYFNGKCSLEESIDLIKKNSRHYAKRQYTYFKHQMDVTWFDVNYDDFSKTILDVENYIVKEKKNN